MFLGVRWIIFSNNLYEILNTSLISYHPQFSFSLAFLRKTLPPCMYPIKFNNFYNDITFHLSLLILHFKFISQLRKIRSRSWLSISIKILIKIQILVLHRYFIDTSLFPSIFSSCIDKNFIHYSKFRANKIPFQSLPNLFPKTAFPLNPFIQQGHPTLHSRGEHANSVTHPLIH